MDFRSLQSLALSVGEALTLGDVFKRIVEGLAAQEDVALARVWPCASVALGAAATAFPECS
jgi:hypothetical protein